MGLGKQILMYISYNKLLMN